MFDYLIVGSGFFGSICARELTDVGKKVCVIDNRDHIGGNCYTSNRDGINVHDYGPHIFHTSNEVVWKWINQFADFNDFTLRPVANYEGEVYSLPFNMWRKNATELPKEIIKRLPVRFTYDNNYFNDKYQGIPIGGYTQIFEKLLDGIEVRLETDFFKSKLPKYKKLIYTGPIDRYFDYKFGELEYKTTEFQHKKMGTDNYQGVVMMNYTEKNIPYTRTIEHKHFESVESDNSWVTWEYPAEYKAGVTEPYYPVNDKENTKIYNKYKNLSDKERDVYFGGRLAEYKYYDMHKVIESALDFIKKIL